MSFLAHKLYTSGISTVLYDFTYAWSTKEPVLILNAWLMAHGIAVWILIYDNIGGAPRGHPYKLWRSDDVEIKNTHGIWRHLAAVNLAVDHSSHWEIPIIVAHGMLFSTILFIIDPLEYNDDSLHETGRNLSMIYIIRCKFRRNVHSKGIVLSCLSSGNHRRIWQP